MLNCPETSIKTLNKSILPGLAWLYILRFDLTLAQPQPQLPGYELRSVVAAHIPRLPAVLNNLCKHCRHSRSVDAPSHLDP